VFQFERFMYGALARDAPFRHAHAVKTQGWGE
jgi:hypothetical protein